MTILIVEDAEVVVESIRVKGLELDVVKPFSQTAWARSGWSGSRKRRDERGAAPP
jgi:hypothetical protein